MNIATRAHSLYGNARTMKPPRELEHELFSIVTGRLSRAIEAARPQDPNHQTESLRVTPELAEALEANRKLWAVLATELAHPDNALPDELKARLLSLAGFVLGQTDRILGKAPADPDALVDVNTAVMRGLRAEVART